MSQTKSKSDNPIATARTSRVESEPKELLFGKKNYVYLIAGVCIIAAGFLLMSGGSMPSPDVWDESLIYSFRRITLAPIVILIGLFVSGMAIFIKK
jgi:hypothetical protein